MEQKLIFAQNDLQVTTPDPPPKLHLHWEDCCCWIRSFIHRHIKAKASAAKINMSVDNRQAWTYFMSGINLICMKGVGSKMEPSMK